MPSKRDGGTDKGLFLTEFSNEIDDLPPPNTYHRKIFKTPEEVHKEIEKSKEAREAEFRRWLILNKPKNSIMTPIETYTAVGVPDIFTCMDGDMQWLECKIAISGPPRIRGTQYNYIKKLIKSGGKAKLVVQRLTSKDYKAASIDIYNMEDIVRIPYGMFIQRGQELVLPPNMEPWYKWKYRDMGRTPLSDLYLRLLLDTSKFI